MSQAFPAPTFGHAAEAFVVMHAAPGAWSAGTAVKYRRTLAALESRLAGSAPAAAGDVAVLGTPVGASALEAAFAAALGGLAPATRARHLSALRTRELSSRLAARRAPRLHARRLRAGSRGPRRRDCISLADREPPAPAGCDFGQSPRVVRPTLDVVATAATAFANDTSAPDR